MELIFLPMLPFLVFPFLAFAVAALFLILFLMLRRLVRRNQPANHPFAQGITLATIALWLAYGCWETYMYYWSKTVTTPIRIDLLLIAPILYTMTAIAIVILMKVKRQSHS